MLFTEDEKGNSRRVVDRFSAALGKWTGFFMENCRLIKLPYVRKAIETTVKASYVVNSRLLDMVFLAR